MLVRFPPDAAPNPVHLSRDLDRLARGPYDVLVIGGGISGACLAWEAAARGLRVALVERDDFGGATSANSLKTIHGGLRYLQDGNVRLVRRMAQERAAWLRIAPHLVQPLPVLMPTYEDHVRHSRWTLGAAARLSDLISLDRNRGLSPAQALPASRVLSRAECLAVLPALASTAVSGGLVWHDAQVYNTERLTLACIQSAASAGARVANYLRVTGLVRDGQRVTGARMCDALTGAALTVTARVVVNAAGPWVDEVLGGATNPATPAQFVPSLAVNLVTRQVWGDYAVGLPSTCLESGPDGQPVRRSQMLFVAPWRGYSLIGTRHVTLPTAGSQGVVTPELVASLLAQANEAYWPLALRPEDVYWVHVGHLPAAPGQPGVRLIRESQVIDHARHDGLAGLITVVGVKYTTARLTAARAVDLVFRKLGRLVTPSLTAHRPLYGGQTLADEGQPAAIERNVPAASLRALRRNHGSARRQVLGYVEDDPAWGRPLSASTTTLRAEVLHTVRAEMALSLTDVVLRRTELGSAGPPDEQAVAAAAEIMAAALGWDRPRQHREREAVWDYYAARPVIGGREPVAL